MLFRLLLAACLVFVFTKFDFSQLLAKNLPSTSGLATTPALPAPSQAFIGQCDSVMPATGNIYTLEPSVTKRSDVAYSGLRVTNRHSFPMVMRIAAPDQTTQYLAVAIHPGHEAEVSLPVGNYSMSFLVGRQWCNINTGFSDGKVVNVNSLITITPGLTTGLEIKTTGVTLGDFRLESEKFTPESMAQVPPQGVVQSLPPVIGNAGVIELHQQNGSYFVDGTVNNIPVRFQIDTGASITSIPREVALSAGIYACEAKSFDTANGSTYGCLANAQMITFGNNRIEGFQVAAMPNLKNALLGMNILRYFRIEHSGDVMRISVIRNGNDFDPPASAPLPNQLMPQITPPPQVRTTEYPQQPSQPSQADMSIQREEVCRKSYENDKEYLNARMRQGYSAQEGELLRDRLRQIELAYRICRNRG